METGNIPDLRSCRISLASKHRAAILLYFITLDPLPCQDKVVGCWGGNCQVSAEMTAPRWRPRRENWRMRRAMGLMPYGGGSVATLVPLHLSNPAPFDGTIDLRMSTRMIGCPTRRRINRFADNQVLGRHWNLQAADQISVDTCCKPILLG